MAINKNTRICAVLFAATFTFSQNAGRTNGAITPVTGESWLHHINRSFDETSMAKTGILGPQTVEPPSHFRESMVVLAASTNSGSRTETVHGSDLYRLNCQGCHGSYGLGAPPEIASLIDPVRSTSAVLVSRRMKMIGMTMSRLQTAELANQSREVLLKRLNEGGTDMPSFHHLRKAEIRSLVAYLNQLAGVPGAEKEQVALQEPSVRVGELIVKSTCHVCHDSNGLNPTPVEMSDGAIPPLSALPPRVDREQLVRKVTKGAPVVMGTTSSLYRGRMPVFSYLTEIEAADVYEYLTEYPPTKPANFRQPASATPSYDIDPPAGSGGARAGVSQSASTQVSAPQFTESDVLPVSMGLVTAVFLGLGCWITLREFKRISVKTHIGRVSRPVTASALWGTLHPGVEAGMDPTMRSAGPVHLTESLGMEDRKIS